MDRFSLVKESFCRKEVPAEVPASKVSDWYGELVFDRAKMARYLDTGTLQSLLDCIDGGKALDRKTADAVASGMKEWAMEHGVTHVCHWFQPLTEGTAEKHDSLIDYDGRGGVIETFDGINGSGKHNNWSLGTDNGTPLLAPGKDAKGNLQFVTFFVNVLAAVQKHNALLKASIATATNAHRLGANEAPPAIVSAFLGKTMTDVLHKLLEVPSDTPIEIAGKKGKRLALVEIPEIFVDNTDRNRTSPFAFTGNRFEFRAVGSCANCAGALTTLNAAVAEQLMDFKAEVDAQIASGKKLNVAIMDALKPIIKSILGVVCFDGNGYTEQWKKEAARRGLDVETNVPKMFCEFTKVPAVEMFTRTGVFSPKELEARNEVKWETYVKKVQIESRVMVRMAINHIIPAALEYKSKLLTEVEAAKTIYGNLDNCTTEMLLLDEISKCVEEVRIKADAMKDAQLKADAIDDAYSRALAYHDIAETFPSLRRPIDKLEEIVDNTLWPLPKYREMLFIN